MLFNFFCRRTLTHATPNFKLELRFYGLLSSSSFSSSASPTAISDFSNQHSFTVTYLINSCGFSPEAAILASRHVDLSKSPNRVDSVVALLMNQGFNKKQVSNLIGRHPKILLCDPEKILLPNFRTLNSIGLSSTDLVAVVTVISKNILRSSFQKRALPSVNYLRSVLGSDDKVITAIKRFPLALTYDLQVYAVDNIRTLREIGVPESGIVAMLTKQPRSFLTSADRFRKVVGDVQEMGFEPSKTRFLWAIHAIRSMSKTTWDKKVELYKKWGWSEDEIFTAFERYPGCMMASMDKITSILDFLVNTMGWERSYIVQRPIVICFSLEKRIIPRCLVYLCLAEKGLTEEKDDFCFNKWLMYSETKFLKWVVKRYEDEAPELLKLYQKHLDEANGVTPSIRQKRDVV